MSPIVDRSCDAGVPFLPAMSGYRRDTRPSLMSSTMALDQEPVYPGCSLKTRPGEKFANALSARPVLGTVRPTSFNADRGVRVLSGG